MVKGNRSDYNDPEHDKQLRKKRAGGLSRTPGCFYPSQHGLPYVLDGNGSQITAGDWVCFEDEKYRVVSVDVSAKTVDLGHHDMELATDCVGVVRSIDELAEDGVLPKNASRHHYPTHHTHYRGRLYDASGRPRAGHRDYRFSRKVVRRLKDAYRENELKRLRESRAARQKEKDDKVAPRVLDGNGQMHWRRVAQNDAKYVATVLETCPCGSGLTCDWCNKCDLPGSGRRARDVGVTAPLHGGTSNESFEELTGMSRIDFARYERACMHPAPPELVLELLGARRMLNSHPVRSMELEHVSPRSRYLRSVRGVIGFAADGKTPNDATKGAYRFCELQKMYWRDNTRKGRGFSACTVSVSCAACRCDRWPSTRSTGSTLGSSFLRSTRSSKSSRPGARRAPRSSGPRCLFRPALKPTGSRRPASGWRRTTARSGRGGAVAARPSMTRTRKKRRWTSATARPRRASGRHAVWKSK